MIASLRGTLAEKGLDEVIIDVRGVGYRVFLSLITQSNLPAQGEPVFLRIRTIVKEDAIDLYGFLTATEEALFLMLTSVSQVGPKAAMNMMSGLSTEELIRAIASGNSTALTKLKGVGKKTAERIVLELKDKVGALIDSRMLQASPNSSGSVTQQSHLMCPAQSDLVSALTGMGYKGAIADRLAESAIQSLGKEASLQALLKEALKLSRK